MNVPSCACVMIGNAIVVITSYDHTIDALGSMIELNDDMRVCSIIDTNVHVIRIVVSNLRSATDGCFRINTRHFDIDVYLSGGICSDKFLPA